MFLNADCFGDMHIESKEMMCELSCNKMTSSTNIREKNKETQLVKDLKSKAGGTQLGG